MAPRRKAQTKRRIESYDHRDKERAQLPAGGARHAVNLQRRGQEQLCQRPVDRPTVHLDGQGGTHLFEGIRRFVA